MSLSVDEALEMVGDASLDTPDVVLAAEVRRLRELVAHPKHNREKSATTRYGVTHKATILAAAEDGGASEPVEFFITANGFPDGRLAEVFITTRREGSTINGLLDALATVTSIALQYGVPLRTLVDKFSHTRFEPMGRTRGVTNITFAKSLVDYVFRYLGETYLGVPAEVQPPQYDMQG